MDGKDYYFLTPDEFRERIANDGLLEWEEVYADRFYGTLKSEVERILNDDHIALFDVDVKVGSNRKTFRATTAGCVCDASECG